ncbi:MAG: hypothetical protein Q8L45_05960 [Xanthomonadaceae bacterium]|nr:hypothetical protein [Xanthomonadaceae bacterium]MDZ4115669.1 hypothetical protein [Xanthomonadaceae bacterium]
MVDDLGCVRDHAQPHPAVAKRIVWLESIGYRHPEFLALLAAPPATHDPDPRVADSDTQPQRRD